ncbi:MAG: right-handed parallel beta-helix repeat-containing protein [Acidobacteria bacterium]|nr:right-handed parallel beta-helix repeat-containing protein [Acidobacteriota bacterium]
MTAHATDSQRRYSVEPCLRIFLIGIWLVIGLTTISQVQAATTYYVNAGSGNDNNDGTSLAKAWRTITKANSVVRPGDTVFIYSGRYREAIAPERSGTAQMRISYRAAPGETVVIESAEYLLKLRGKSYITIEGMTFQDPIRGWGEIQDGDYNELMDNKFIGNGQSPGTAYAGLYIFDHSSYNRIINNEFQNWGQVQTEWGDAITLSWYADYNLIEGNQFINAGHALLDISTSYNVVRYNYFENAWQKGIDLVWRVGPPWAPSENFVARRNVIEYNVFNRCRIAANRVKGGTAIQISAARTIFRRNLLIENEGGGITLNGWLPDAPKAYGSRIYHNTVAANGFADDPKTCGVFVTQWGFTDINISNTVLKNNIFYRNAGERLQLLINLYPPTNYDAQYFRSFLIAGNCTTRASIMDIRSLDGEQSFLYYQDHYPQFVRANLDADPQFANPAAGDYRLMSGSPCVDAALPLTYTTSAGSGQIVSVADASYFSDGYNLAPGDQVKVGANPAVRVIRVDYTNNTLTLAQSIHWMSGDSIYGGEFNGSGPDIGAFEAGGAPRSTLTSEPFIPVSYSR